MRLLIANESQIASKLTSFNYYFITFAPACCLWKLYLNYTLPFSTELWRVFLDRKDWSRKKMAKGNTWVRYKGKPKQVVNHNENPLFLFFWPLCFLMCFIVPLLLMTAVPQAWCSWIFLWMRSCPSLKSSYQISYHNPEQLLRYIIFQGEFFSSLYICSLHDSKPPLFYIPHLNDAIICHFPHAFILSSVFLGQLPNIPIIESL